MEKLLAVVVALVGAALIGVLFRPLFGVLAAWAATTVAAWFGHTDLPSWFFWAVLAGAMVAPASSTSSK
jgi:hypothetical protein